MQQVSERFEKYVMPEPNTGCWLWAGSQRKKTGYGGFKYNGKMVLAHRMSFFIHKGEFDESLSICHSCDNPQCVNPDHLFLGTHDDNMKDMKYKGRGKALKGSKHLSSKLTESQVIDIKDFLSIGVLQKTLAEMYSVHKSTIQGIDSGKTWKHV